MSLTQTPEGTRAVEVAARRATRSAEGSYLGGVAGGLATHLGVRPRWVRVMFVVTALFGFGLVFYAGLWLALPLQSAPERSPGLDAASRQGKRPGRTRRWRDAGPLVAVGAVLVGTAGLLDVSFNGPVFFWPVMFAVAGVMLLWRQADEAQRERWLDTTGRVGLRRVVLGDGGPAAWARIATGLGLLATALVVFAAQTGRVAVARDVVLAAGLGVLGLAVTLGPWLLRLASDLTEERAERIRSQERADVAAHLHDSVLQTLALIQKHAAGRRPGGPAGARPGARPAAVDVRRADRRRGHARLPPCGSRRPRWRTPTASPSRWSPSATCPPPRSSCPLVRAAREAMMNAARHAGAARVDVYAEVGGREVEVFVRDRGRGFDPDRVAEDRLGVRGSIIDRMERHGGSAAVRSAPGEGTEVRLHLSLKGEGR